MSLFIFLVIAILLCSLILLVQGGESKTIQVLAFLSIGVEVIYLLLSQGTLEPSIPISLETIIPCGTGAVGLVGLFKMKERSVPLLIFFVSLIQFFLETKIIESLS